MARLLFIDDHPLYRAGVEVTLGHSLPDLDVVLAGSAEEALAALDQGLDVDLCLSDLRLPGEDGLALLEVVGARWPSIARGVLCAEPSAEIARRARSMGCIACLSKARDMDDLAAALNLLFTGQEVFDIERSPDIDLSLRRRRVLEMAAKGLSNKEIARELGISERTVKDHWAGIFGQLAVANRVEAVSRAHQLRLLG
ncbi:MAG: response regulator transcription factor [Pseudomonadota bacterium]